MISLELEPNGLIATWLRYDWRESFFAPRIVMLQALLKGRRTASGAGLDRETAFQRCLGETAEYHALAAQPTDFHPLRDGLAAHLDNASAQRGALLEAFERQAVLGWWHGAMPAQPVAPDWLRDHGIDNMLALARSGAALKRRTGFWVLATRPGQPVVAICRSSSPEGQDPILGFGCDAEPGLAVTKALRELFLMEMNLMELLAARGTGQTALMRHVQDQITTYSRQTPALLPREGEAAPESRSLAEADDIFGVAVQQRDITPPDGPVRVWLCRPQIDIPELTDGRGSPFF